MKAFWKENIHPITGFKCYNTANTAKYAKKNYVPKNTTPELIEEGIEKKSGKYRAVYSFGKRTVKKIVLGKFKTIEEARNRYLEYINTTSKYDYVCFSKTNYKFLFKLNGETIWSLTKESDDDFIKRVFDLYKIRLN